jgi:hypothetical protein
VTGEGEAVFQLELDFDFFGHGLSSFGRKGLALPPMMGVNGD